jgi:hypothetical protein
MSLRTKTLLGTIWYVVLVFLLYVVLPPVHRSEFDRAFASWRTNQSPQNEAVVQNQQRRNVIVELGTSAVLALVLLGGGFASYEIFRRTRR